MLPFTTLLSTRSYFGKEICTFDVLEEFNKNGIHNSKKNLKSLQSLNTTLIVLILHITLFKIY